MTNLKNVRKILQAMALLEAIPLTDRPRTAGRIAKQAGLTRSTVYRSLPRLAQLGLCMVVPKPAKNFGRESVQLTYFITSKGQQWLESQKELL